MKSILEKFYGDGIQIEEKLPSDPDYRKALGEANRLREELAAGFSDKELSMWNDLWEALADMDFIERTRLSVDSFRLGARMMLETMSE